MLKTETTVSSVHCWLMISHFSLSGVTWYAGGCQVVHALLAVSPSLIPVLLYLSMMTTMKWSVTGASGKCKLFEYQTSWHFESTVPFPVILRVYNQHGRGEIMRIYVDVEGLLVLEKRNRAWVIQAMFWCWSGCCSLKEPVKHSVGKGEEVFEVAGRW